MSTRRWSASKCGSPATTTAATSSPATAAPFRCKAPAPWANSFRACVTRPGARRRRCTRRFPHTHRSPSTSWTPGCNARWAVVSTTWPTPAAATTTPSRSTPTKPRAAACRASSRWATRRASWWWRRPHRAARSRSRWICGIDLQHPPRRLRRHPPPGVVPAAARQGRFRAGPGLALRRSFRIVLRLQQPAALHTGRFTSVKDGTRPPADRVSPQAPEKEAKAYSEPVTKEASDSLFDELSPDSPGDWALSLSVPADTGHRDELRGPPAPGAENAEALTPTWSSFFDHVGTDGL